MADEQLAPSPGEPEGAPAPVEEVQQQEADTPPSLEDFARERGWKPKEEFQGDENDWRPAKDFLSFGLDRNKDLMRDVREMRSTIDNIGRTTASLTENAVRAAREEERARLEGQLRQATREGDENAVVEITQKVADLKHAPTADKPDPVVERFVADNPWFMSDRRARAVAEDVSNEIAARGGSVEDQLRAAKQEVERVFPHYGKAPAKPAPSVAAAVSRTAPPGNRKKGFNDMPAAAQDVCRQLVAKGYATTEGYVANYFSGKGAA